MNNNFYPGDLKTRIKIIKEVKTSSASGEPITAPEVFKTCFANQFDVKANEEEEGKVRFLFDVGFIVRYNREFVKGQINGMQIEDVDGYKYNIISVIERLPKRYLQINTKRSE